MLFLLESIKPDVLGPRVVYKQKTHVEWVGAKNFTDKKKKIQGQAASMLPDLFGLN